MPTVYPCIPPLLMLPFILYSILILMFGLKKNDKPLQAVGWLGFAIALVFWFFLLAALLFVFFVIYFIGTLIWLSIKYGDEPLWKPSD